MPSNRKPTPARATLSIEGDIVDVLAEARRVRGGRKSVAIKLNLMRPGGQWGIEESYGLAVIEGGHTGAAIGTIRQLAAQGRISDDDERRLADLIEQFGLLT